MEYDKIKQQTPFRGEPMQMHDNCICGNKKNIADSRCSECKKNKGVFPYGEPESRLEANKEEFKNEMAVYIHNLDFPKFHKMGEAATKVAVEMEAMFIVFRNRIMNKMEDLK